MSAHADPFAGPGPRVFSIPAGAPFLRHLAVTLNATLDRPGDPFGLADAIVLLPTRRAGRALADAFLALRGEGAALLPRIRALGDIEPDEAGLADLEASDIPPAASLLQRRFELARLVRARLRAAGEPDDAAGALAAADALAALLDAAALAEDRVTWEDLPRLVRDADLAAHWQASAEFLAIVAEAWPARLAELGLIDPGARRREVLLRLARRWEEAPPAGPVVVAGSTGSVAATRALMKAAAGLPRGCVVLPGLDAALAADARFAACLADPQHPQHGLARTLQALDLSAAAVRLWPGTQAVSAARAALIHEALAAPVQTGDWRAALDADPQAPARVAEGLEGLGLIEAATEAEEAEVIALALREALETPGRTAALVTPSAPLARRVAAKLARWDVRLDVSSGRPLIETPQGALLKALLAWGAAPHDPVALLALVKQPLATLGGDRGAVAQAASALERIALRGVRLWEDWPGLSARLADLRAEAVRAGRSEQGFADAAWLLEALEPAHAAFLALPPDADLAQRAQALAEAGEAVCDAQLLWGGEAGEAAQALVRDLLLHGAALGPVSPEAGARTIAAELASRAVRPRGAHPRLSVWGPLEARLQSPDLVILGGLNEGVWPAPPPPDPFLSAGMREALGLPSAQARMGLQAHDFAQAASGGAVLLTRAERLGDAPATPSRWIWRLSTLARGALGAEASQAALRPPESVRLLALARAAPPALAPASRPEPRPPLARRPKQLSATDVERLVRDPYAIYARKVLGLRVLDPLDQPPGAAQRGMAVHAALQAYTEETAVRPANDPQGLLLERLETALRAQGFSPIAAAAERRRLAPAMGQCIAFFEDQRRKGFAAHAEQAGAVEIKGARGAWTITSRADRIDIGPNSAESTDFKTGKPPTLDMLKAGFALQLQIAALTLAAGGFPGLPARPVETAQGRYARVARTQTSFKPVEGDFPALVALAERQIAEMIDHYADPASAYPPVPATAFFKDPSDYDLLSRRAEWGDVDDSDADAE